MQANLEKLRTIIASSKRAVIAFSGGVDSTFLSKIAGDVLGAENVLLITATSSTYPEEELRESQHLASFLGLPQLIIKSEEIEIEGFAGNPPDRCYYCKRELFAKIRLIAQERNFCDVYDGSNVDDLSDYRPGRRAIQELSVRSPLCEAGLTKMEIRELSASLALPTASKASFACLASRFPYGEKITAEKLQRVGKAESALRALGLHQFRVRSHGPLARIEVAFIEIEAAWVKRAIISQICRKAGFTFVAIDVDGYRTGAMNEVLPAE
jgi:pyridinium-3,5-biscarboxylic acid mononucleotide sulfurtransferase